jgi:fucose 4-O-acetylase-like acetyltransferase
MGKKYLAELDIARGLAIIGVVFIHTSYPYLAVSSNATSQTLNSLARYSVPLFILISGFLHYRAWAGCCGQKSYLSFIAKRFRRLIFPYVAFSVFYMLIRIVLEHAPVINSYFQIKYTSLEAILKAIIFCKGTRPGTYTFCLFCF